MYTHVYCYVGFKSLLALLLSRGALSIDIANASVAIPVIRVYQQTNGRLRLMEDNSSG